MKRAVGKGKSDGKELSVIVAVRSPLVGFSALGPPVPPVPQSGSPCVPIAVSLS